MNIIAIIPARSGSKGVPGKNIRLLGDYPLLAYSVVAAKLSEKIGRVIVSTDSAEIAAISKEYGAEAPFLRPAELALDHSTDQEYIQHVLIWLQDHEGVIPDYLVQLRPTTPLRNPAIIDAAIETIDDHAEATSLRSAHPAPESPFKWFQIDARGYFQGLMNAMSNDLLNNPRQQFPEAYIPNGYVDVIRPSLIIQAGVLYGDKMIGFIVPRCIEIDTVNDFDFLEYDLHRNGSVLWEHLKKHYPKRGSADVRI